MTKKLKKLSGWKQELSGDRSIFMAFDEDRKLYIVEWATGERSFGAAFSPETMAETVRLFQENFQAKADTIKSGIMRWIVELKNAEDGTWAIAHEPVSKEEAWPPVEEPAE